MMRSGSGTVMEESGPSVGCSTGGMAGHMAGTKHDDRLVLCSTSAYMDDGVTASFVRMTKKRAGRTLDGRIWNELPVGRSG